MQVSLLIPAFEAERFLPAIFADARRQSPNFAEILVYDDASKDQTSKVAQELGADKVIRGEVNRGASHARNQLIEAARFPWVHFHDADDRMDPRYLSTMEALNPRPNEVVFCGIKVWDVTRNLTTKVCDFVHLNEARDLNPFLRSTFPMGCGLYPLSALRKINGFRSNLRGGEDFDMHIRLLASGIGFRAIPEPLNTYCRYGNTTFTETNAPRLHRDMFDVLKHFFVELPADTHGTLAELTMEHAYKLYVDNEFALAREAIDLANKHGRHTVSSVYPSLRFLSRLTGPEPIFWARRLKAKFPFPKIR